MHQKLRQWAFGGFKGGKNNCGEGGGVQVYVLNFGWNCEAVRVE
jgi:hypothetical protein